MKLYTEEQMLEMFIEGMMNVDCDGANVKTPSVAFYEALNMRIVGVSLPSDKEINFEVLDIIDKNLQCGTGKEKGILCNRFATVSFIRNYIKKLVAH